MDEINESHVVVGMCFAKHDKGYPVVHYTPREGFDDLEKEISEIEIRSYKWSNYKSKIQARYPNGLRNIVEVSLKGVDASIRKARLISLVERLVLIFMQIPDRMVSRCLFEVVNSHDC